MPILNYTTSIAVEKTVGQIQATLAKAGAQSVLVEYDDERIVSSVSFRIHYNGAMVSFRLPAQLDPVYVILQNDDRATNLVNCASNFLERIDDFILVCISSMSHRSLPSYASNAKLLLASCANTVSPVFGF